MASHLTDIVKKSATEPLLTGALLYLLTKGPAHIRERLLRPFQNNFLSRNGPSRIAYLITILKILTGLGVLKRANKLLNSLAWNRWALKRPGSAFQFGPGKEELVVITGGSSGFGYEMVKAFSQIARVIVLDVQAFPDELSQLPDVQFYQCDLADMSAVEALCQSIREAHGEVSVLINNAGITYGKTILNTSNAECQKLFQVNLISHFVLIRAFLPGMLQRRKGHIVTIASMASFVPAPGLIDYCCSKIGELYLSEGIRAECATHYPGGEGICTSTIHPSWHATGMLKGREEMLSKHGIMLDPPSCVSDVVVDQVLRGRSGRVCVPAGGEGTMGIVHWPRWVQDLLLGMVWRREGQFEFGKGLEFNIPS